MPKKSKYPKLRKSVKHGRAGQTWVSYWYDNRGTGKPDVALGTDYQEALRRWAEIHYDAPMIAGTLEEAFREWEKEPNIGFRDDGKPRSAETISGYLKCLRALRPVFGRARWDEVDLTVLFAYVKERSAKGRARQEMQVMSVVWGFARLRGLTDRVFPGVGMQKSGWKGAVGVREVEVETDAFAMLYKHADQTLRDALDIASATGLRVKDILNLRISDVRGDDLRNAASKTGKRAEYDLNASQVLKPLIERRLTMKKPEHVFLLAAGRGRVTYRMLADRFTKARELASAEHPECSKLWLRDMRKYAGQLAPTLAAASELLQHSSPSVTRRHYRPVDRLKPVR